MLKKIKGFLKSRTSLSRFSFALSFLMAAILLLVVCIMSVRSSQDIENKVYECTESLLNLQIRNFSSYFDQLDSFSLSPRNDTDFLKIVKTGDENYANRKFITDMVKGMYYRRDDISFYSIFVPSWNKGFCISRENRNIREVPFSDISSDPYFAEMKRPKRYKAVVPAGQEGRLLLYYRTIINIESGKPLAYIKFEVDTSWLDTSWIEEIPGEHILLQDYKGSEFYHCVLDGTGSADKESKAHFLVISSDSGTGSDDEEVPDWKLTAYISRKKINSFSAHTRFIAICTGLIAIILSVSLLVFFVRKNYVIELNYKNALIKALEAQINPHFLYNTLQTISAEAIEHGQKKINDMVMALASMLKYTLHGEKIVSLRTELEHVADYLFLQKARFDTRLTYEFDVQQELLKNEVPKMSIITLVENAIIHGMSKTADSVRIELTATLEQDKLVLTVTDDGRGMSYERLQQVQQAISGRSRYDSAADNKTTDCMGLRNLAERLYLLYGEHYNLKIFSTEFTGTSIVMEIDNV